MEYERTTHSETVYNEDRLEILRAEYNGAGQPTRFYPAGPIEGLNVSYDTQGRMQMWQRGQRTIINVYDEETGNLQETRLADGSMYKYTYNMGTKVSGVTGKVIGVIGKVVRSLGKGGGVIGERWWGHWKGQWGHWGKGQWGHWKGNWGHWGKVVG